MMRLDFWRVAAFLLGMFSTMGCVYVFSIGDSSVSISLAFAMVCLVGMLVFRKEADGMAAGIDRSVILFLAIALCSSVVTLVLCVTGVFPDEALPVPFRGYAVLVCCIAQYYVTVRLYGYRDFIIRGLVTGIIASFVLSILAFLSFERGTWFSLYTIFPQPSFAVAAPYASWGTIPEGAGKIAQYRPQGFFLECSHLMIFLIGLMPLAIYSAKSKSSKTVLMIFAAFACVTSKSPNALFLLAEALILWRVIGNRKALTKSERRIDHAVILIILTCFLACSLVVVENPSILADSITQLGTAIADLDVVNSTDGGTSERWDYMQKGALLLGAFPFGAGYNTETFLLTLHYGDEVVSTHTLVLKLLLEVGPLGLAAYVYMIARHSICLLKKTCTTRQRIIGLGVLFMAFCQFTNGVAIAPWMWMLLGMAHAERLSLERASHVPAKLREKGIA